MEISLRKIDAARHHDPKLSKANGIRMAIRDEMPVLRDLLLLGGFYSTAALACPMVLRLCIVAGSG